MASSQMEWHIVGGKALGLVLALVGGSSCGIHELAVRDGKGLPPEPWFLKEPEKRAEPNEGG